MKNITLLGIVFVLACGISGTSNGMEQQSPTELRELSELPNGQKVYLREYLASKEFWMTVSNKNLNNLIGFLNDIKNFICYAKRSSPDEASPFQICCIALPIKDSCKDSGSIYIFNFRDLLFSNMLLSIAIERDNTDLAKALILAHQREPLVNQAIESVVDLHDEEAFSQAFKQALMLERKEIVKDMLLITWDSGLKEAAAQEALLEIVQNNRVAYATELLNNKKFLLLLDMGSLYQLRDACQDAPLRTLVCQYIEDKDCCIF